MAWAAASWEFLAVKDCKDKIYRQIFFFWHQTVFSLVVCVCLQGEQTTVLHVELSRAVRVVCGDAGLWSSYKRTGTPDSSGSFTAIVVLLVTLSGS